MNLARDGIGGHHGYLSIESLESSLLFLSLLSFPCLALG